MQSSQTLIRHHSHYNKPTAPQFGDRLWTTGRAVSLLTHAAEFDNHTSLQQVLDDILSDETICTQYEFCRAV